MKTISSGVISKDADIYLPGCVGRESLSVRNLKDVIPNHFDEPPPRQSSSPLSPQQLREGIPETVFPPLDDRRLVSQTKSFPFSAICSLEIIDVDLKLYYGTGFLAGPRLVITAGHNVYYGNRFMKQITVYPGLNGNRQNPPFRPATSKQFFTVEAWVKNAERQFDCGAIVLPTDLGSIAGYLSVSKFTDNTLSSMTVSVVGYPKDPPDPSYPQNGSTMWQHAGRLSVEPNRLLYLIDTTIGQSGAPVIAYVPEASDVGFHAVGIHNWAYDAKNAATRINDAIFSQIVKWRQTSDLQ